MTWAGSKARVIRVVLLLTGVLEFSVFIYYASVGTPPDARPVLGLGVVCEADISNAYPTDFEFIPRNAWQRLNHVVENLPSTLPFAQTARLQLYGVVEGASPSSTPPSPLSFFSFPLSPRFRIID